MLKNRVLKVGIVYLQYLNIQIVFGGAAFNAFVVRAISTVLPLILMLVETFAFRAVASVTALFSNPLVKCVWHVLAFFCSRTPVRLKKSTLAFSDTTLIKRSCLLHTTHFE